MFTVPCQGLYVLNFGLRNKVTSEPSEGLSAGLKKKVYCSDLSTSQGGKQTCFL